MRKRRSLRPAPIASVARRCPQTTAPRLPHCDVQWVLSTDASMAATCAELWALWLWGTLGRLCTELGRHQAARGRTAGPFAFLCHRLSSWRGWLWSPHRSFVIWARFALRPAPAAQTPTRPPRRPCLTPASLS